MQIRQMTNRFPTDKFKHIDTPFYYYDCNLLRETLQAIHEEVRTHADFIVHYAVKANANAKVLKIISQSGCEERESGERMFPHQPGCRSAYT